MRALWLNPAAGVAGDMLLGALVGAGADEQFVRDQLERLDVDGWSLRFEQVVRCALTATHARVEVAQSHDHRHWSSIDALLAGAGLDERVARSARSTFRRLGEAEATAHGIGLDEVHFHEVGALDAIVDVVGVCAAVHSLGVDRVVSAPVGLGAGTVGMSHGVVPVPAPAVLELLRGHPVRPVDHDGETATPTGAALLVTLVDEWGPPPAGTIVTTARGAGTRDPAERANVVVATVLDMVDTPETEAVPTEAGLRPVVTPATLIECNVDDVAAEVIAFALERVLEAGASDAWATPIVMKKGRPAHVLSVLCPPGRASTLAGILVAETGTLGYRLRDLDKVELPRSVDEVEVEGHRVRIKTGPHSAKPEHDDVAAAARATGRTHRDVATEALRLHRS